MFRMAGFHFQVNPKGRELSGCSAVLNGHGTRYEVSGYRTTLSLKSVVRGAARYRTRQGEYLVTPDSYLVLNDGQIYSMEFEGGGRIETETLCPFFQRGFLGSAAASAAIRCERQLDYVEVAAQDVEFCERLYPKNGAVGRALESLHAGLRSPGTSGVWLEDRLYGLAASLAQLRVQVRGEVESFPGLRPSTRMELYRRLHRGRDFLTSCYGEPLTVSVVARVAGMSPFHFQRMFKLAFGVTTMRYLQEVRLQAARRLLAQTGDGVTDICFAVGCESLGSFSWLFRRRFGVSPREFRGRSEIRRIREVAAGIPV